MKSIAYILFVSFLVIVVTPLALMNTPIPQPVCEAETVCCRAEEDMNCDLEDMECCPGTCSPTQCVFCCFLCPVNNDKIVVKVFDTGLKTYSGAEQFLLPGFTSECWQPPELA